MAQNNNILQELNELNSSLANITPQNIYTVPDGYFDGLAIQMLNRIRAMEAVNVADETNFLSPILSAVPRKMPYAVPDGYFELLAEQVLLSVHNNSDHQTANEELAILSPVLSGLKKEMTARAGHPEGPYSVPQGYFDTLHDRPAKQKAKIISMVHRKWFRYAAAAVVTGIIALTIFISADKKKESEEKIFAQVKEDVMKMDDTQKDNLVDFIDAGMNGKETAEVNSDNKSKEIKQLLQDVSDEELKDFQEQTEDLQDVLMTN